MTALLRTKMVDKDIEALLDIVKQVASDGKHRRAARSLFDPTLHPRGIKEFAASTATRIAAALVDLLESLDRGSADQRIEALRGAREEVLHNGSDVLPINTARVLLEVMKDLVRSVEDGERQIELARDFLDATTGKPRLIRILLRRYHLLEMPEQWNQVAYDHRVHDANSTGRKTPTHLIMDAWIKGIRYLGVVYYNHVPKEAAAELLEAGEIMGVHVRIGVDLTTRFRGKRARLVLFPRGFQSRQEYLAHLSLPGVRAFMEEGRKTTERFHEHVLRLLDAFNQTHLGTVNDEFGLDISPIDKSEFIRFVSSGQASRLHLAEFIHAALLPKMRARAERLLQADAAGAPPDPSRMKLLGAMDDLVPEEIKARFLTVEANPELGEPLGVDDQPDVPTPLHSTPVELLARIEDMPCGTRVVLCPTGLSAADVLEILYDGGGLITHLELFNLQDWSEHSNPALVDINRIRKVLNEGNIVELKRMVREQIERVHDSELPDREDRVTKLREILSHLPQLKALYTLGPRLGSRLCSGSTGRSRRSRGMGLVVVPTLGARSRRRVSHGERRLPVRTTPLFEVTYTPREGSSLPEWLRSSEILRRVTCHRRENWSIARNATRFLDEPGSDGNIAALGGAPEERGNGLIPDQDRGQRRTSRLSGWRLPGQQAQIAKVLLGFLPAFLTFWLTQDWWVLAWFGAVIWFGITGLRNVLQSVVGGGGISRSPLLRWNDLVSWSRVADSLLFTGFSVPLLDYLVKTLLLDRGFGVTMQTSPLLLYSVIALANGIYISSHNTFRGLPVSAIVGNFFRSVLSIPVALLFSALIGKVLIAAGVPNDRTLYILQLGAAVVSKAASDTVAGLIEGSADRGRNMARARRALDEKLEQLNALHARMEALLPETSVLDLLGKPKKLVRTVQVENDVLVRQSIINALDLMYFWYYQPRAQTVFRAQVRRMSAEQREVVLGLQRVLERKRTVSEMLLDGLVGKRFERSLGFYLNRVDRYLASLQRLA